MYVIVGWMKSPQPPFTKGGLCLVWLTSIVFSTFARFVAKLSCLDNTIYVFVGWVKSPQPPFTKGGLCLVRFTFMVFST